MSIIRPSSCRNDMFELSHRLIGIYKTSNATRSACDSSFSSGTIRIDEHELIDSTQAFRSTTTSSLRPSLPMQIIVRKRKCSNSRLLFTLLNRLRTRRLELAACCLHHPVERVNGVSTYLSLVNGFFFKSKSFLVHLCICLSVSPKSL